MVNVRQIARCASVCNVSIVKVKSGSTIQVKVQFTNSPDFSRVFSQAMPAGSAGTQVQNSAHLDPQRHVRGLVLACDSRQLLPKLATAFAIFHHGSCQT
jgi:hypothetical protein